MKFINRSEKRIKVRTGKRFSYTWITVRLGETIDLPKDKGKRYGLSYKKLQNVTEGKIGKKKVETKQFSVPEKGNQSVPEEVDFSNELIKIKGIGYNTAEDILKSFTKKELIKAIKLNEHLPFRDDVAVKLIKEYGK